MISVIIPAYNEEENIKTVIDICKENKNVSETEANNNTTQTNTGLNNSTSQSVSNMYDIAYLREVKAYIQNVLDDFDTNCFSQTW